MELFKSVLGEHHPDTLTPICILACLQNLANNLDEAISLTKLVVAKRRMSRLGARHADTLASNFNLAPSILQDKAIHPGNRLDGKGSGVVQVHPGTRRLCHSVVNSAT